MHAQFTPPPSKHAFSLVELSIVLVVLGLLTGGILAGKSLIRASQLRSVATQTQELAVAANSFKDRYLAFPGELLEYQRFWPQLVGSYCPKTSNPISAIDGFWTDNYDQEAAYAQLLAAGLVQMGQPQILQDGTVRTYWDCLENNMQQNAAFNTKLSGVVARITSATFASGRSNILQFGGSTQRVLTVDEMWSLDNKLDDGKPYTGIVLSTRAAGPGACTSGTTYTDPTTTYRLSDTDAMCVPLMVIK